MECDNEKETWKKYIYKHLWFYLFVFAYTIIISGLYFYFISQVQKNQKSYENNLMDIFETSFKFANIQIINSADRFTESTDIFYFIYW